MKHMRKRKDRLSILLFTLFGVMAMAFGGTALAATAPEITLLTFDKGTPETSDDTKWLDTGYMANRVAIDENGNVYATDPELNTIYIYNNKGNLVRAYRTVGSPIGIAASDGKVYVGGMLNGYYKVFVLDLAGVSRGFLSGWPDGSMPLDLEIDSQGKIFGVDRDKGRIVYLDRDGLLLNTFGPYLERYDTDPDISLAVRTRTRHRLTSAGGVAVNSSTGDVYVSFKEYVDYLTNTTSGTGCYVNGQAAFIVDTDKSYANYANTDQTYKYWCSVASRSVIAVIDRDSPLKPKMKVGIDTYVSGSNYTGDGVELNPTGLSLDNKGRLYVATAAGVRVYSADTISLLTPSGTFAGGAYKDVAFDAVNGRLFGTTSGSNRVYAYGIDSGSNPANAEPAPPTLDSPVGSICVKSRTPDLTVKNASDPNLDPLVYGYEVKDGAGIIVDNNATGIAEGGSGKTSMPLNISLAENASYSWRAQASDGYAAKWSDWAMFRVNADNDNPTSPVIVSPASNAAVSPFSSSLAWNPSEDPDSQCGDYIKGYTVEISGDGYSNTFSTTGLSINVSDLAGLKNGNSYVWRVKAVDGNGGESAYSEGSFVYKTSLMKFESDQPNTKVFIDGNYGYMGRLLGTTPHVEQDITPGSHFVTFIKAGYEPFYVVVNIPDPLSLDGKVTVVVNGKVTVADNGKYTASMVKASKIRPSSAGVELVKINGGNATPFVVDFNNDGLKDVAVGTGDGKVSLYMAEKQADDTVAYINKGTIQVVDADGNAITRAVPFFVDYNNDGRKDLLVGSGEGTIYIYLNNGTDYSPVLESVGKIKDGKDDEIKVANSAPVVVDYNNDGRKDLVVGGYDGKLRLYKNKARCDDPKIDDASPEFDPIYETIKADNADLNAVSNSKPFFTDWNSDGKKDLIVGRGTVDSEGNTVNLLFNIGTDEAPSFVTISGLQEWIKSKKRERGNREFIPYLGYIHDLGDLSGQNGDASPFIVDWDGSSPRDVVSGNGAGGMAVYTTSNSQ